MHFVFVSLISLVRQWKIMLHLARNTWSAASKALTLSVNELTCELTSDALQCNSLLGICNVCVGRLYWAVTLTASQTVAPPTRNWLVVNAKTLCFKYWCAPICTESHSEEVCVSAHFTGGSAGETYQIKQAVGVLKESLALQRNDRLVFHYMAIRLRGGFGLLSRAAIFKIRLGYMWLWRPRGFCSCGKSQVMLKIKSGFYLASFTQTIFKKRMKKRLIWITVHEIFLHLQRIIMNIKSWVSSGFI